MNKPCRTAIIAAAVIVLAWSGYFWVRRSLSTAPVTPEVFLGRIENLRDLRQMDPPGREAVLVSLARLFRRVPLAEREVVLADPEFRVLYNQRFSRDERFFFITYTLPETLHAPFEAFLDKPRAERARVVRQAFARLKDNETIQEQWPPILIAALDNETLAGAIADNIDIIFADPSPMGAQARRLLYPMMLEAREIP